MTSSRRRRFGTSRLPVNDDTTARTESTNGATRGTHRWLGRRQTATIYDGSEAEAAESFGLSMAAVLPAVFGRNGGRDEDGGDLANLATAFPSDGGDWSSGGAWLDSRRRRRRTG
uniref:DUF834 domain-containing protein n=1 Tax=Oryza meridionalis TaxID=40149 RepID=A0A0E0E1T4_9ORYZ